MGGKLTLHKWYLTRWGDGWYAERDDGKGAEKLHGEHCKACAAVTVCLKNPDADFDLRSFRGYDCYGLLATVVLANRRGEVKDELGTVQE